MDLVSVARIARARGVGGEVWLDLLREEAPHPRAGDVVYVGEGEASSPMRVERLFAYEKGVVLKLEGIGNLEEARSFVGLDIRLPRERVPEDPEGTFDADEILGYAVVDARRGTVGTLTAVARGPAYWILTARGARWEFEVPMVKGLSVSVNDEERRVTVDLPGPWPGLDEDAAAPPAESAGPGGEDTP